MSDANLEQLLQKWLAKKIERASYPFDEHDQWLMLESGRALSHQLATYWSEQPPQAMIYPDTAGRLLYYLWQPVAKRLAALHNTPQPLHHFVVVNRGDLLSSRTVQQYEQAKQMHILKNRPDLESLIQSSHDARATNIIRVQTLIQSIEKAFPTIDPSQAQIYLVDDQLSHSGTTVYETRKALSEFLADPEKQVPLFALLSSENPTQPIYQEQPNLHVGKVVAPGDEFHYRRSTSLGVQIGGWGSYSPPKTKWQI